MLMTLNDTEVRSDVLGQVFKRQTTIVYILRISFFLFPVVILIRYFHALKVTRKTKQRTYCE